MSIGSHRVSSIVAIVSSIVAIVNTIVAIVETIVSRGSWVISQSIVGIKSTVGTESAIGQVLGLSLRLGISLSLPIVMSIWSEGVPLGHWVSTLSDGVQAGAGAEGNSGKIVAETSSVRISSES